MTSPWYNCHIIHATLLNDRRSMTPPCSSAGSVVVNYVLSIPKENSATQLAAIVDGIKNLNGSFAGYDMDPDSVGASGMYATRLVCVSHVLLHQIKSNQIKSNQIKSNQIKSNQIKSNQIKSNQIKSNQITHVLHKQ